MINVTVTAVQVHDGECDACSGISQRPVWDIAFEDIGTVSLCIFHLDQLVDELVLIKKHKVSESRFTLGSGR